MVHRWINHVLPVGLLCSALGFLLLVDLAHGQTTPSPDTAAAVPVSGSISVNSNDDSATRLSRIERQVDALTNQVQAELRASNTRFEATTQAISYASGVFVVFGGIGSLLAGAVIVFSWIRSERLDIRHKEEYERERTFYETQVLSAEKRQDALSSRDELLGRQHLTVGQNIADRSAEMLTQQLDGIRKLAGVIDLVDKTFEKRHEREDEVSSLVTRFKQMDDAFANLTAHFRAKYRYVSDLILPFQSLSRMDWPNLAPHEEATIRKALDNYQEIPAFIMQRLIEEEAGENRYKLAQINYLLGVGAFYTADISGAASRLEGARELFGRDDAPPDYIFPQAFCSHFLGVLHKNWREQKVPLEVNLGEAKRHLEDAARRLKTKQNEFLTPLTLAEVDSYIEQTQDVAKQELADIIDRLERLKNTSSLDPNQKSLLGRAFLLRGNIQFRRDDKTGAHEFYLRSFEVARNSFALLSAAQTMEMKSVERSKAFGEGLTALEAPGGPLSRREASGKITAIGWGIIASHEIGDGAKSHRYRKVLDAASADVRSVSGREPLFFCPIAKTLVNFDGLKANIERL